ncbi:hypothetical protein V2J09_011880 [Rumex salicifolius]
MAIRREMMNSVCSFIALFFVLFACVELCDAATAVDVYRLIQYDLAGAPFGSRFATLNHHAGSSLNPNNADLSRTVVIVPIRKLVHLPAIKDYIVQKQPLGGLLFLLPRFLSRERSVAVTDDEDETKIRDELPELEKLLVHSNLPYPVYFAFEDDNLKAVLADIEKNDATGQPASATTGGFKLVVSTAEPRKVASPTITNIQGWLPGLRADGDSSQLPTIGIVASYDTFGTAPALSVGSDSSGSGVVALLEVARLFSLLYSNSKTRGRYNLLFGLTSDQRQRESIDYAICLNSIGSLHDELFLHVSKPPENAYIKQIFQGFSEVAGELGMKVGLKHKKINISNSRVAWEHEQFSRLRITAATLSELSTAPEFLEKYGGLSDSRAFVSESAIIRNVKLVAESLARHIYGLEGKNVQIFADNGSLAVNPSYIESWLDLLSSTPRLAPLMPKGDPFINALKRELEEHTANVNVQHDVIDGIFTFYDSTKATLNIYQVASVTFDLLLLLALGSYLIVLFSFLVITTRGLDDLISIFRRPPSRKMKTA